MLGIRGVHVINEVGGNGREPPWHKGVSCRLTL